ncbi:general substrate transporter [Pleomassaria siparia CBS 279.74]|uniref:General substrate transporter n=1 Tax=Pleomassaria siparia CBS 279.74 TaxID=1314801 RepID=A0A6G1KAG9_9PLEO|nr:general substrate transporter [Pleomassaria siparia CBS 279.74]
MWYPFKGIQPYFGMTGAWLTFWVTVACATDMTLFGYDQGVFGGVIVTPDFLDQLDLNGKTTLISTVTAIYDIGCFFGAISVCVIGDPFGRKKCVMIGTCIMSVGAIIQIASFNTATMIVGRIIAGIGNGINTSTAPVWQGETSKASWRGKLIVIEMIMNIAGFSLSNWVTYGFSYVSGPAGWRVPLAFQFLFIFVLFATVPWLPESPRWLIAKGRVEEAEKILADLEATHVDDPFIITQSKEIQWAVQYEKEHAVRWRDLLRGKTGDQAGTHTIRRLFLGMGTQAMQQLSGINVTSYYLPTVLITSVGLTNNLARLLAACNSVSYLLFSTIGIPNVERWGRRKMMMYAAAGQFFCYAIITICIRYNEQDSLPYDTRRSWAKGSIAFFFLYYVFFGIGWQGVPWLYPTEINSMAMRTKGAALGTATNWIFNFMVVEITPPGIESLHWRFYIIWTVFNFAFIPTGNALTLPISYPPSPTDPSHPVYFFYPETAGRTLEDLDRYFAEDAPLLVFRDKEAIKEGRPERYQEHEQQEIRRHSSVALQDVSAANMTHRRNVMEEEKDTAGYSEKV